MASPDGDAALAEQRKALALELAQGLRELRPLAELQAIQSRLQLIDDVLATRRRPSPWRRQLLALLIVGALVSLAALIPMPRVDFTLEAEADAIQLAFAGAGQLGPQRLAGEVRAEGFARMESPDPSLHQRAHDEGVATMSLRADRASLRALRWAPGARLDLQAAGVTLRVASEGAAHTVALEVGGELQTSFGGAPRVTSRVSVAEWLRLSADAQPTELWLTRPPREAWLWRGLQPASLRFVERMQEPDAPLRLQSAVRRAALGLPATRDEWKAPLGAVLELDGLQVERCELIVQDTLTVAVSGSASRIVTASGRHTRSLVPSLLEYVARNHSLGLLWSAAGLLWGISAWTRRQFDAA